VTKQGQDAKGAPVAREGHVPSAQNPGEKDTAHMNITSNASDDAPLPVLDERIQAQIGKQLTSFYKELINQPIPQNFIDLLAKLDRQEGGK
jgi:hypothetical protein